MKNPGSEVVQAAHVFKYISGVFISDASEKTDSARHPAADVLLILWAHESFQTGC